MEVQFGPNAQDEPNLLYKLQRKIKVFDTKDALPSRGYNLVASSSKFGIAFVASPDATLSVFYLNQLIDKECDPQYLSVRLPEKTSHIAVSCHQELLAVTGGQLLCIYNIADFQNPNVSPALSMKTEVNPTTFVSSLQWNPCIPDNIAIAFYDGTLLASQVTSGQINKVQSKARCICWSPKGKQLVTGNSDGTLCQYKPNLTPAKLIPAPNLFEGAPVEVLAVYWISTFQFAAVYKNATDNSRPSVTIVNTPKAGQPSCLNYEDICYSTGSNRPWYYYLQGIPQWNLILSSSSNSMEIATLGSADGSSWLQWCQTDEARPELPLTDKKIENYPVGLCIDTSAIHQLPWGENEVLPHMPLLLVVSQTGLLTIFNVINMNKQAPPLCSPPQQLQLPAAAMATLVPAAPAPTTAPPPQEVQAKPAQQPQTFAPQPVAPQPIAPLPVAPQQVAPQQATPQQVASQFTPQPQISVLSVATSAFGAPPTNNAPKMFQPQLPQGISFGQSTQAAQKAVEVKPTIAPASQPQAQVQPKPTPVPAKPQPTPAQEAAAAAMKAEQEKVNKQKANQELKDMLIKEVNDFQMELYKFMVKTRETQAKLQQDIEAINTNFNLQSKDAEQLKKECSLDELRNNIFQLKLELVKACAVVAEARTHAEAKDIHQWTQVDPLTNKRISSVKKLAYYVQNQVEQAQKALDYKWNIIASNEMNMHKPGHRMIRPILDDVYQPLVKQQEILCRQQAVLRTLRNTLKECEMTPMFKSASLLRSTPFKNKDPLSKLTKNILNMSIEPQNKTKEPLLNAQKLDALKDMLSNHKTIKIKPVSVEMRQRLAAMKINYEKNLREKAAQPIVQETKVLPKVEPPSPVSIASAAPRLVKFEPKQEIKFEPKQEIKPSPISIPSFSAISNLKPVAPSLSNVARTLFTDEPNYASTKPQLQQPIPISQVQPQTSQVQPQPTLKPKQSTFTFAAPTSNATNTRSVLKELLQNKQALANAQNEANVAEQKNETHSTAQTSDTNTFTLKKSDSGSFLEQKNDANIFMGQKICSPSAFGASSTPLTSGPSGSNLFTAKPISDITNMFSKFQPQAFVPESKPQEQAKPKSSETGEPETPELPKTETKKVEKPMTNLFGMKTSTPLSAQNVPDVLKIDKPVVKLVEKIEKAKENIPEKSAENATQSTSVPKTEDKIDVIPFGIQSTNKTSLFGTPQTAVTSASETPVTTEHQKETEIKTDSKPEVEKSDATTTSSSLFAAANAATPTEIKSPPTFTSTATATTESPTTAVSTLTETTKTSIFGTPPTTASSLFGSAVAASSFPTKTTQSGSIFSTNTTNANVFASSPSSIFSTPTSATPTSGETTTQSSSIFGTTTPTSSNGESKPSVFSSPTPAAPSFGTKTTQSSSVFESSPAFATTNNSAFSSTTVFGTTTTTSSIFGGTSPSSVFRTATATTTAQSLFGSPPSTTSQSVFTSTTSQSLFGGTPTTTQSLFGSTPATTASAFGSTTPTPGAFGVTTTQSLFATTSPNVFGTATTTQGSLFGAPTTTQSMFGAPSTQSSVFGTSNQSVFENSQATQSSIFGSPTQTTQSSLFGGTAVTTTAQSGSLFGGGEANLFAAASISTTSAPSQTSGGNIFGGGSGGSVFGGGNTSNVFGGKAAFGQSNTSAGSIFGGSASFGQKPAAANNFWSGGNTSGGGFGSGFGQQATTQASSIFGGTGGSFSQPSTGQPFGSPQQNAGFGENKPSIFGSPQQQTAPAFGGSAVFGSKPAFGQSAASPTSGGFGSFSGLNKSPTSGFGAPATFGGSAFGGGATFGGTSPSKMFGGSPAGFGSPTQSNATFESLATQNTLTFGNLAQQSGPPPQQQPTFNTSPSFTGWRG
ncbi:nuclear pore complex protein Nup214 isoform X2 [Amyelois transitella]|uniref:nuclear pore complex protein Nup214 isoform X2 n=1 Tax=Amyelois transitella TaxID=680683 RepID=UPI00067BEA5F|nr:nuclear pore complex protein Nup214 isoform X2 [Amyelois transitella]